jgi:tripartite-type tricarboxylate transporter receptor subunit TctC
MLKTHTGIQLLHVPYKGGGPALVGIFGGEVSVMFGGSSAAPHVRAGKLRALALAGKRNPAYPDLPALSEFYPGVEVNPWLGLFAPSGLPAPVLERIRSETGRMLADPATRDRVHGIALDPFPSTPQQFAAYVRSEFKKYGAVVTSAGIRID